MASVNVGVDNIGHNVSRIAVGVDGVGRFVSRGYAGVDNVARLIYQSGPAPGEYGSPEIAGVIEKPNPVRFDGRDWIVLDVQSDNCVLMLKKIETVISFDVTGTYTPNYDTSTLRTYCQNFETSMSEVARNKIISETIPSQIGGNPLYDKVWAPDVSAIQTWTDYEDPTGTSWGGIRMWPVPSVYAIDNEYAIMYWTRTPYATGPSVQPNAWVVYGTGTYGQWGAWSGYVAGFRPCIRVSLV